MNLAGNLDSSPICGYLLSGIATVLQSSPISHLVSTVGNWLNEDSLDRFRIDGFSFLLMGFKWWALTQ